MVINAADQDRIVRGWMPAEEIIAILKRAVPKGCGDPVAIGEVYRLLLAWTRYHVWSTARDAGQIDTLKQALLDFKASAASGSPKYSHKAEALYEIASVLQE